MTAYYADDDVTLYLGDMREVLPGLQLTVDAVVADPPYGALCRPDRGVGLWDIWPDGWLAAAAEVSRSMWCFGTMRMLLTRCMEFAARWQFSHDVVWSKGAGTGRTKDRFRPAHEIATHWYQGPWGRLHHDVPRLDIGGPVAGRRSSRRETPGIIANPAERSEWVDDGYRYALSVIEARNLNGLGFHPTEKPVPVLDLLIRYACPPNGTVLDPFAGSGSTAVTARMSGRKSVLIEADERYCEAIVNRLAQTVLEVG